MTVTPATLYKGSSYEIVPEGFGGEPTKYQLSADAGKLVTIKFPSVSAHKGARVVNEKISAVRQDLPDITKIESMPTEEQELAMAKFDEIEEQIRRLQYEQMKTIVAQSDVPAIDDCFAPMTQRIVMDFLTVLTSSYGKGDE